MFSSLFRAFKRLCQKTKEPEFRRIATYTLIGIGLGALLAIFLTVPGLNIIGFSVAGPVAGSLAAGIQSSIGSVAAGSLFAMAQSTAMGAGVAAVFPAIGGAVAGGLTLAWIAAHKLFKPIN